MVLLGTQHMLSLKPGGMHLPITGFRGSGRLQTLMLVEIAGCVTKAVATLTEQRVSGGDYAI